MSVCVCVGGGRDGGGNTGEGDREREEGARARARNTHTSTGGGKRRRCERVPLASQQRCHGSKLAKLRHGTATGAQGVFSVIQFFSVVASSIYL